VERHVAKELVRARARLAAAAGSEKGSSAAAAMETEAGEGEEKAGEVEEEDKEPLVEVWCGQLRVPAEWTLAEAHARAWVPQAQPGEMVLLYREAE